MLDLKSQVCSQNRLSWYNATLKDHTGHYKIDRTRLAKRKLSPTPKVMVVYITGVLLKSVPCMNWADSEQYGKYVKIVYSLPIPS